MEPDEWQAVSSIVSVGVAIAALLFAVRTDWRSEKRTALQVAPILTLHTVVEKRRKGIVLTNKGSGPARITGVEFIRAGRTKNLAAFEVIDLPEAKGVWTNFRTFGGPESILGIDESFTVLELTESTLKSSAKLELGSSQIEATLEKLANQISEMQIVVNYTDVTRQLTDKATLSA